MATYFRPFSQFRCRQEGLWVGFLLNLELRPFQPSHSSSAELVEDADMMASHPMTACYLFSVIDRSEQV